MKSGHLKKLLPLSAVVLVALCVTVTAGEVGVADCTTCHDVPGLYICGGSVFPTSGAINPALTIMALAARTANHLIDRRSG